MADAIRERLLPSAVMNPAQDVRVSGIRRGGRQMQAPSNEVVGQILYAATTQPQPYRRWAPLLLATTGGRASTILNLRGCDVREVDGYWCVEISADAGPTKTRVSERIVPLHAAVIDAGFLDLVKERGSGRLFYEERRGQRQAYNPGRTKVKQLRDWVRGLGLRVGREQGIDPLHSFRHWLKRTLRDAGVSDSVSDAITGHAPRGDGAAYGGVSLKAMSDAIGKVSLPGSLRLATAVKNPGSRRV